MVATEVKVDAEKVEKAKILVRAFDLAGGVPDNFLKSSVVRVSSSAWRVNIWTCRDNGGYLKENRIEYSFYIKD